MTELEPKPAPGKRKLSAHIVPGDSANHQLSITVMDDPGPGGAHHEYFIHWPSGDINHPGHCLLVGFQNGPIKEFGVNGVTQEAMIAICMDRLECFQAGQYACQNNADAHHHLKEALKLLQARTRERIARGVEGTHAA